MNTQEHLSGARRYFNKTQKEQILKEHREQGTPISQLARRHGITPVTVYQWKRLMNQIDESMTPEKIRELLQEISNLKNENKLLKLKVADLSISNDIKTEALDIVKKRAIMKQLLLEGKSKPTKNSK